MKASKIKSYVERVSRFPNDEKRQDAIVNEMMDEVVAACNGMSEKEKQTYIKNILDAFHKMLKAC